MSKKKPGVELPRHVFKKDGPKKWGGAKGITYSECYVKTLDEYNEALEDGFIDDFNEALFGDVAGVFEEVVETKEPEPVIKKTKEKKPFFKKETSDIDDDF